uniref:Uncharacterized protein LOC114344737 n=1 Tax=Diabrotica virgifera virgifera TaxID=50390 RepID=A0A6P7H0W6_DIAVI
MLSKRELFKKNLKNAAFGTGTGSTQSNSPTHVGEREDISFANNGAEKSNYSIRNYEQPNNNDGQQSPDFLLPDNKSLLKGDLYLSSADDSDLDPTFSPTDTSSCESDDELYFQKGIIYFSSSIYFTI